MPIIGKGFKEINSKRYDIDEDIELGHNENTINVVDIKETKIEAGLATKVLEFEYDFKVSYLLEKPKNKKLGEITIKGSITYHDDEKVLNKIMKDWKKNKKLDPEFMKQVMGRALYLCQIEAINQATKVLLPSPVPIPSLKIEQKKD